MILGRCRRAPDRWPRDDPKDSRCRARALAPAMPTDRRPQHDEGQTAKARKRPPAPSQRIHPWPSPNTAAHRRLELGWEVRSAVVWSPARALRRGRSRRWPDRLRSPPRRRPLARRCPGRRRPAGTDWSTLGDLAVHRAQGVDVLCRVEAAADGSTDHSQIGEVGRWSPARWRRARCRPVQGGQGVGLVLLLPSSVPSVSTTT